MSSILYDEQLFQDVNQQEMIVIDGGANGFWTSLAVGGLSGAYKGATAGSFAGVPGAVAGGLSGAIIGAGTGALSNSIYGVLP